MEEETRLEQPAVQSQVRPGAAALWLAAAVLTILFLPLSALFEAIQADVNNLQLSIVGAQVARISPLPTANVETLRSAADELTAAEERLDAALAQAAQSRVPWQAVLERIIPEASSAVSLTDVAQQQDTLRIQGTAGDLPALTAYAGRLQGSLLFADVRLEITPIQAGQPIPFIIHLRLRTAQP